MRATSYTFPKRRLFGECLLFGQLRCHFSSLFFSCQLKIPYINIIQQDLLKHAAFSGGTTKKVYCGGILWTLYERYFYPDS